MKKFIDKYGHEDTVEQSKDGVEINITGNDKHIFAVLNNHRAQELGKAIINASGGLKL